MYLIFLDPYKAPSWQGISHSLWCKESCHLLARYM